MNELIDFFRGLFDYRSWPPRWKCGYWSDFHGWLYIASDLMVWLAYFLIPLIIINYFNKKRTAIHFHAVYVLFASFILLCGSTHFLDALMFWVPVYRFNALIRFITGVVSLFTVYHLFKVLPVAFKQKTSIELEQEIARREQAELKLAEANKGLQAFASMASHDLQEPLRKIKTFTSLLYETNGEKFDSRSKGYAEKITQCTEKMQTLIRNVLTLSTLADDVPLTEVDTAAAVNNAIENLEVRIEETSAEVNVTPLPKVKGNEAYLTQLFFNLISNALKFTDKPPRITITGTIKDEKAFIKVADNGIGMHQKDYTRIFEAFKRLHERSKYEGTGIGLAICKRIMDIHQGTITVDSELGEGTTFTIELAAV